jgi:hypothetical protein
LTLNKNLIRSAQGPQDTRLDPPKLDPSHAILEIPYPPTVHQHLETASLSGTQLCFWTPKDGVGDVEKDGDESGQEEGIDETDSGSTFHALETQSSVHQGIPILTPSRVPFFLQNKINGN